jgi:glycerol uptake facilitator-like aquaporin
LLRRRAGRFGLRLLQLRRSAAEALGTFFLVAIVVGSGIATGQLFENAVATGAGLMALIALFGPVSGAHFNPLVTLSDRSLSRAGTASYIGAQLLGGTLGAIAANVMFDLPAITFSTNTRSAGHLWFAEVIATFGLVLVATRSPKALAPFAVGGYITAAYFFTSSTSFANPAVTVGRMFTDTFSGIRPSSAPAFIAAQIVGGALAIGAARYVFKEPARA